MEEKKQYCSSPVEKNLQYTACYGSLYTKQTFSDAATAFKTPFLY